MKLYYSPGACSLSPHIVLREADLPFELEQVDVRAKKLKTGEDFLSINPKGQVPVLALDDGDRLTEGPAIVQFIADRAPASGLIAAAGSKERYHAQEWLNFITSELHKSFSPLFRPNTPDAYKSIARDNIASRFGFVDKHLADRPYLMGDRFTVADAYLFVMLNWAKALSIDVEGWQNLVKYRDRVAARPKVQEAMKAEGLVKAA
jgi:glutathione S-transferase